MDTFAEPSKEVDPVTSPVSDIVLVVFNFEALAAFEDIPKYLLSRDVPPSLIEPDTWIPLENVTVLSAYEHEKTS